ncbi:MAG TPA: cytochrome c maturation protein CcmE [Alphaproteobacteria bacterium]|jgi:cytochrome c-type biogenesis protein CcmE|nr:cytochrome c maturation protein CcmE [Alphaproteobacteria bacterium]MDP7642687.1 cytochrome c maturation protein CcmE [Alphaproteobacteria bacterium]HJN59944.1 cytochrome c maturation protein CcmE [Alphaproteobacteria bacterium]
MKRKHRRLLFVGLGMAALGIAAALILLAFDDNLVFFFSPTEMQAREFSPDQRLRIGGLVEEGSVVRDGDGLTVRFNITDTANVVAVTYSGVLPALFDEGQGVVAEGHMQGGTFEAAEILAKHDENYMPREVADALKESGQWQGEEAEE